MTTKKRLTLERVERLTDYLSRFSMIMIKSGIKMSKAYVVVTFCETIGDRMCVLSLKLPAIYVKIRVD